MPDFEEENEFSQAKMEIGNLNGKNSPIPGR